MRLSDINNILTEVSATVTDQSPWDFIGTSIMIMGADLAAMLLALKDAKNAGQIASGEYADHTRISNI